MRGEKKRREEEERRGEKIRGNRLRSGDDRKSLMIKREMDREK